MEKKLELKHLACYLPYGLKGVFTLSDVMKLAEGQRDEVRDKQLTAENVPFFLAYCKPLLKPLSGLPQEIVDMSHYDTKAQLIEAIDEQTCPHNIWRVCVANHFDVHGLLRSGLALNLFKHPQLGK